MIPTQPMAMTTTHKGSVASGPYKATQLWNDVLQAFKSSVPVGKRRRHMRSYDKCFVASEAINWLLYYLQNSPNFGHHVTRENAIQLLQKFHKLGIFEDVRGTKHNKEKFDDGSRLFRFLVNTPSKNSQTPGKDKEGSSTGDKARAPLSTRTVLMNADKKAQTLPLSLEKEMAAPDQQLSHCHLVARRTLSPLDIEEVWKGVVLQKLKEALRIDTAEDILDPGVMNSRNIIHNSTHINRNGVVTNLERKEHVPPWVLSIMKCLAHWPEETEEGLPNYPNFERDMFKTVETYYKELGEPLISYELYETFITAYMMAKYPNGDPSGSMGGTQDCSNTVHEEYMYEEQDSMRAFASMENLMMNLTMQASVIDEPLYHPAARNGYYSSRDNIVNGVSGHCAPPQRRDSYSQSVQNKEEELAFHRQGSQRSQKSLRHPYKQESADTGSGGGVGIARRGTYRQDTRTDSDVQERHPDTSNTSDYCSNDGSMGSHSQSQNQNQRNPPPHQLGQGASSVWSVYSQFKAEDEEDEEEYESQGSQRCLSLADLVAIKPYPENTIARTERVKSWVSMQSGEPSEGQGYGYSVVVATTPKPHRARKVQGRARSYSQREVELEHAYCQHADSQPWYVQSEKAERKKCLARSRSEVGEGMFGKPAPPPPYIPPPSYRSIHQGPQSAGTLVTPNSYQTARSQVTQSTQKSSHTIWDKSSVASSRGEQQKGLSSQKSRVNMQESYRMAMYANDTAMTPPNKVPINPPMFRNLHLANTSPNVSSPETIAQVTETLRLLCLLLPPGNRRKLHLLLRLMWRMEDNYHLVLDPQRSNRHLLLSTFTSCILQSADGQGQEDMSRSIVEFMVDNHQQIFAVSPSLRVKVEEQIRQIRQVTAQEYEQQKLSSSQRELRNLLDAIISDEKLSPRKKKKKIKNFQKAHPDIYAKRFPQPEPAKERQPDGRPKIKQPLLSKPLQKFKSIRL